MKTLKQIFKEISLSIQIGGEEEVEPFKVDDSVRSLDDVEDINDQDDPQVYSFPDYPATFNQAQYKG